MTLSVTLMLLVSGCATVISEQAICDGTDRLRDDHTDALIEDGGDQSVITGATLLDALDRACLK